MANFVRWQVAALLGALACSCTGKDPYAPGTSLGTFTVSAKLESSTCGSVPDPWSFDVRLRYEETLLHWVQGGLPVSGTLDGAMQARLASTRTETVREADAKAGTAACVITRTDALDVALKDELGAAVTDPSLTMSFNGALTYGFAPAAGANCWDQIDPSNGYATLPCEVRYAISATRTAPPR